MILINSLYNNPIVAFGKNAFKNRSGGVK